MSEGRDELYLCAVSWAVERRNACSGTGQWNKGIRAEGIFEDIVREREDDTVRGDSGHLTASGRLQYFHILWSGGKAPKPNERRAQICDGVS